MLSSGLRKAYTAGRPTIDDAIALVLPAVNAKHHGIVLLDQAGWHGEKALAVPVGGAIHGNKSVHISLLHVHDLSRTHCPGPTGVVESPRFSSHPDPLEATG
jgi:hypothetical protein